MTVPTAEIVPDRRTRTVAVAALLAGGVLLAVTLDVRRGTVPFYVAAVALAGVWIVGFVVARSPRLPSARPWPRAGVGALVGAAAFVAFLGGRWLADRIPPLGRAVDDLLATADAGRLLPVLAVAWCNGVAEELFFRGTLIAAVRRRWAWVAGVLPYALTTAFSRNPALILAAIVMGLLFTLLRLRTSSLVAPIAAHLAWSTLMILALPR